MGGPELLIIAIVAIIVIFGVNKLPQIARNVGKAQNEFKRGLKEGATDEDLAASAPPTAAPPAAAPPAAAPPAAQAPAPAEQPAAAPQPPAEQPPAGQNP